MFTPRAFTRAGCLVHLTFRPILQRPKTFPITTSPIPSILTTHLIRNYGYGSKKDEKEERKTSLLTPSRTPPVIQHPNEELVPTVMRIFKSSRNVADHLHAAMRHMVHPVVIVTTSYSDEPHDWRAITLSSFNSLSLSPQPLVSFNIKKPSECSRAMHKRGEFIIHTMLPTPRAADFAARFSQPYKHGEDWRYTVRRSYSPPSELGIKRAEVEAMMNESDITECEKVTLRSLIVEDPIILQNGQFARVPVALRGELPVLTEEVMFRLHCQTVQTINIQDHELWIAKVLTVDYPGEWTKPSYGSFGIEDSAPLSLLYGDRAFRESGLKLIERNNKFRRWFRRKIDHEEKLRMDKLEKLQKRLERARANLKQQQAAEYYMLNDRMATEYVKTMKEPIRPADEKRKKVLANWQLKIAKKMNKKMAEANGQPAWKGRGRVNR